MDRRKHGRIYRLFESGLDWLTSEYERGLRWVLKHQGVVLPIVLLTFALNGYLYVLFRRVFSRNRTQVD